MQNLLYFCRLSARYILLKHDLKAFVLFSLFKTVNPCPAAAAAVKEFIHIARVQDFQYTDQDIDDLHSATDILSVDRGAFLLLGQLKGIS